MQSQTGVGKNVAADRALQLLQAEREYVQLHRDTTAPGSGFVDTRTHCRKYVQLLRACLQSDLR